MKYLIPLILIACSHHTVEPKFCWKCHERNWGWAKTGAVFGDAYTTVCDKSDREIKLIEADKITRTDSTEQGHQIKCVKSERTP
jgi:hypothetical protein